MSPKAMIDEKVRQVTFSANYTKRSYKKLASLPPMQKQHNTILNQAAHLNVNRTVLYKRGHFIETANSFFIIEISTTPHDGSLIIAAFDIQSNVSMVM